MNQPGKEPRMRSSDSIVGREGELATIDGFVDDIAAGARALLIEGEAGIGKTTLWREAISAAADRGFRVLTTRAVESETRLSFAALSDLLDASLDEILPHLSDPQRRALEVALLRADADGPGPDQRTVSVASLSAVRLLAASAALIIAIDDVQWLDHSSARVLSFVLRRLEAEPIRIVTTLRATPGLSEPLGLAEFLPETRFERLPIGPLKGGAMGGLLRNRLGETLPRPTIRRIYETSGGNPFFALEISRALARDRVQPRPGELLPIPQDLEGLLRVRLATLSHAAREVLLVTAA